MIIVFDALAYLPLPVLHWLGGLFGWVSYLFSKNYARLLRENLRAAYVGCPEPELRTLLHANIREMGKGVLELPWVWRRPLQQVLGRVRQCHGWEHIEAAHAEGRGVIALTPHLGCFEIISLYIAARLPITSMYSPPRQAFLDQLMHEGRERGQMKLAAADMSGVRQMLKALRRAEAIGILPDQVPGTGEGEWAPFFGRPAYTMTLIGRLAQASGAAVVMCRCERLPRGAGYALYFTPLPLDAATSVPAQLNAVLENTIRQCPQQYLWSYNRYKVPLGTEMPSFGREQ